MPGQASVRGARLLGVAIATALAAHGASAQMAPTTNDTVQVYGRLDASANAVRVNDTTRKAVTSDTSLIGFRGTEQLGDGLVAYFKMEHGLNIDSGMPTSSTVFWNREVFVGLGHRSIGYVEFGEHWSPGVWLTGKIDPFGRQQLGAVQTLAQGTANRGFTPTYPNSIELVSPDIVGLKARVLAAAPEGTIGKHRALGVDYLADRLFAGLLYDDAQTAGSTVGQPSIAVTRSKTLGLGATWRFDWLKLFGYAQQNKVTGLSTAHTMLAGVAVPLGLGEVRASLVHTSNQGADASLVALGCTYFLSKRTQVYATVAHLANEGRAKFAMWPSSQDLGAGGVPVAGHDVKGIQFGLREYF